MTSQNGVASSLLSVVVTREFSFVRTTSVEMARAGGYQRNGPGDGEFARMQMRDVKVCLLGVRKKKSRGFVFVDLWTLGFRYESFQSCFTFDCKQCVEVLVTLSY